MAYVNPITIWHKPNAEDWLNVTNYTLKDGFPDGFEETLKGDGINDYQVKEFTFNLHKPSLASTPARLDFCKIIDAGSGTVLLNGFIDEIRNEFTDTPEYTIFPNALLLKDTLVGLQEEEAEEGEDPITEFRIMDEPKTLAHIVSEVADSINSKKGTSFYADEDSVPQVESEVRSFFGNVLGRFRRNDFIYRLLSFIFSDAPGDGYDIRRKTDNTKPSNKAYYIIEKDSGFFMKTFISIGQFLSFNWATTIPVINYTISISFNVPWFDFRVPTLGAYYYVREAVGGGLTDVIATYEFFPLGPFYDSYPNIGATYGSKYNGNQSSNITNGKLNSFLGDEGFNLNDGSVIKWDYDDNNSYVLCHATQRRYDLSVHELLLSFETPFDNEYRVHYRNKNGADVLKQLALVSNRWFYVDATDKIHFLPRNEVITTIELGTKDLLEFDRKTEKEPDGTVDIDRYEMDKSGKVQTYGIVLRKNELDAIENQYKKFFTGTRNEFKIKIYNPPKGLERIKLMDEIAITDYSEYTEGQNSETEGNVTESVGRVTSVKQSFLENWVEIKTEVSNQFELSSFQGTEEEGEGDSPEDPGITWGEPEPYEFYNWEVDEIVMAWVYTGDWEQQHTLNIYLQQETYKGSGAFDNILLITQINTSQSEFSIDLNSAIFDDVENNEGSNWYRLRLFVPDFGLDAIRNILIYANEQ